MLSFLQIFIHAFRFNLNKTNHILSELSKNSYSVYIIHMVVLGVVALAMINLPVHGGVKYVLLSAFTFLLSNMIIYSWREVRQKSVSAKTVVTAMAIVFVIGTAFQKTQAETQTTEEQSAQKSANR